MEVFLGEWANLLLRWAHLVVGIGWIGTSFYFMALDYSLSKRERMNPGVLGTAWQVHGGGFYHVEKYTVAPAQLPPDLHWFKWEAYLTWVTGFGLMIVQYYLHASAYLIDPSVLPLTPWQAIAISLGSIFARLGDLRRPVPFADRAEHDAAGALRVRADRRRLGALHPGLFRPRRLPACRRAHRQHHGDQRVCRDHSQPEENDRADAARRDARSALRRHRQAALDPQQLPHAAGAGDDGVAALSVPVLACAGLDGGGADPDFRRADPPLPQSRRCRRRLGQIRLDRAGRGGRVAGRDLRHRAARAGHGWRCGHRRRGAGDFPEALRDVPRPQADA